MSKQIQNKKAGLYYRLSQEDERVGESLSIENQKKILENMPVRTDLRLLTSISMTAGVEPISTVRVYRDCWRMPRTAESM